MAEAESGADGAAAAAAAGVAESRRRAAKEAYDAAAAAQMAATEERAATAAAHHRGQADAPPPAASLTALPAAPLPSVARSPWLPKPGQLTGQLTPGLAGRSTGPADGGRTGAFDPRELYDPLGLIGRGSYGSVFRARDRRSGELVAIKVAYRA